MMRRSPAPMVEVVNGLVRDELATIETYRETLPRLAGEVPRDRLAGILDGHLAARDALADLVRRQGGVPRTSAGSTGILARTVGRTAGALGSRAVLATLRLRERRALQVYRAALSDPALPNGAWKLIHEDLLPQQNDHLHTLEWMIHAS